jgi:hypothetical protein
MLMAAWPTTHAVSDAATSRIHGSVLRVAIRRPTTASMPNRPSTTRAPMKPSSSPIRAKMKSFWTLDK